MGADAVERIWNDAVSWYRSGVHPALQVCVRREGQVVLDRAIGHARGNGPKDSEEAREGARHHRNARSTIYSGAKAITAFVTHLLPRARAGRHRASDLRIHPGLRAPRQGRDHDRATCSPTGRGCRTSPGTRSTSIVSTTATSWSRLSATRSPSRSPGQHARLPRRLGRIHPRRGDPPAPPARTSARCSPRRSSTRSASAGPTTGSRPRTPAGSRSTTSPARPPLPPLSNLLTRALGKPLDDLVTATNDDRVHHRDRSRREPGDQRERAVALLRADALRGSSSTGSG